MLLIGVSVIYGWAISADSAIYSTAVTEVAEPSRLGSTMAVHSFLGFMGGVIGPILAGVVLDVSPETIKWGLTFSCTGMLAIAAILGLARLGSTQRSFDDNATSRPTDP